jgi:RND family efflux transporter MFP subunit
MYKRSFSTIKRISQLVAICTSQLNYAQAADLDCMVKPEMYIELSSPAPGVLESLSVNKGDRVAKGQAVAHLEASVEIAKVNQAKQDALNNSEINNKKVQLEFAKRNRARYQGLFQKSSISQFEKDKADTEVTLAEIELAKAVEQKRAAALALELAKAQLALKTIKSPIDGIVIDRYAMVGESVADRAIMKLAQVDPLRVELIAPTEYFGLIKEGMDVKIRPERPANKLFKATVTIVDQLIDPASGSFSVRMALPNPGEQLIGGVNCMASFDFDAPSLVTSSVNSSQVPAVNDTKAATNQTLDPQVLVPESAQSASVK